MAIDRQASCGYADIIIDISHEQVDRPFQYRIPEALRGQVIPGSCVTVPFGRGDTLRSGYVIALSARPQIEVSRIKEIAGTKEAGEGADASLIRLAVWMRNTYGGTLIQSLKTVLPAYKKARPLEFIFIMTRQS